MNKLGYSKPALQEVLSVTNTNNFHDFFVQNSIGNLIKSYPKQKLDSVLAIGANHVEARNLVKFPFKKIILSGISEPDEKTKEIIKSDKRISYIQENMEEISFKSQSFDIVFVKEAIHHVSRPIKALYEMLRVSNTAVIFIEPQETLLGNLLDNLGLISNYEKNFSKGKRLRDNFVYRWRRKEVIKLLNSYYLESGYKVNFTSCWMSNRYNGKFPSLVKFFNFLGWIVSFLPGCSGNYLICTILPGKDLP